MAEGRTRRLVLTVPDARMSSRHTRLLRDGAGWRIEDQGSRNGTWVEGARTAAQALADGHRIELGRTTFLFRSDVELPLTAPADLSPRELAAAPAGFATLVPALAERLDLLARVARDGTVPVLLLGETGTGKELLAQAIHTLSQRPGRLVPVNCGAIPAPLVESQLFGHLAGAFTGAERDQPGLVRSAQRGTLFLDEIADLPLAAQTTLLRVLQEREVLPVGATRAEAVDLRVVAATHLPIEARVQSGELREDLYGRLAGYVHRLTPLRDRIEDLGLLAAALLARAGAPEAVTLSSAAVRALVRHDWPRNVRELEQCLAVAVAVAVGCEIELEDLPEAVRSGRPSPLAGRAARELDGPQLEAELVAQLERHSGNVTQVARSMGKARMQVQRWMRRFGIEPDRFRGGSEP